jgi:hypothetical protein
MRYSILGAAVIAALLVACDSKPKEEQGAMMPAGSDMVAPVTQTESTTEPANPNEGSSGGMEEPAMAEPATTQPSDEQAPTQSTPEADTAAGGTDTGTAPDAPATSP